MSNSGNEPRLVGWSESGKPRLRGSFTGFGIGNAYRNMGLGRGNVDFTPATTSANAETMEYRSKGLQNARDTERNSETIRGGLDRKTNTVVGPGLRPNPTPDIVWLGQDIDWMMEYQQSASSAFNEWATDPHCRMDAEGHYQFGGLMWQAFRTLAGPDAEVLGMIGYDRDRADRKGAKWGTYVHLIDPDRLSNPDSLADGDHNYKGAFRRMRGGREVDEHGAFESLNISVKHPGDGGAQKQRWENIPRMLPTGRAMGFHWFFKRRAGLQRALTTLAAVLSTVDMLSQFSKATLTSAVSHAYMAAYLKTTMSPEQAKAHMTPVEDEDGNPYSEYDLKTAAYEKMNLSFGGKRIPILGPNDEIHFESLEGTAMDFDPFRNAFLRELASSLGVSFEQLSLDFSRASYSSTRSSILEAWRQVSFERAMFTQHVANLIYDAVIEEAFVLGILKAPPGAPGFYQARAAYTKCSWTGPGMGWVDPLKEINAANERIGSFVTTLQQEASSQGGVWYENIEAAAVAQRFRKKHKVGEFAETPATEARDAAAADDEDANAVDAADRETQNA